MSKYFDDAIKESINCDGVVFEGKENNYYSKEYAKYFKDMGLVSLECPEDLDSKELIPICSIASSARLCFLKHFNNNIKSFEKKIPTGVKSAKANFDYVDNNIYYECKCQEILSKSHDLLKDSYFEDEIFKEIVNCDYNINPKPIFKLSCIGVEDEDYKDIDYNKCRFDVKQFICHLIALAKIDNSQIRTLKYVFFVPDGYDKKINKKIFDIYWELKNEIDAIFNGERIKGFIENHNIVLEYELILISSIEDKVLKDKKTPK